MEGHLNSNSWIQEKISRICGQLLNSSHVLSAWALFIFFFNFMATPMAYGRSRARDWIWATTELWQCRFFYPLHSPGAQTLTSAATWATPVRIFIHCNITGTTIFVIVVVSYCFFGGWQLGVFKSMCSRGLSERNGKQLLYFLKKFIWWQACYSFVSNSTISKSKKDKNITHFI